MAVIRNYLGEFLQSQAHPDRDAYVHQGGRLTYGLLRSRAREIAVYLDQTQGSQRGVPVVVYGHKCCEMVATFVAATLLGRPFIPVDKSTPTERLRQIVRSSGADIVVDTTVDDTLSGFHEPGVCKITSRQVHTAVPEKFKTKPLMEHETFYIMFTSGSTGQPKGVSIPLRSFNDFLSWWLEQPHVTKQRTFLNHALFSFDMAMIDLWSALCTGGTLVALDHRDNIHMRRNIEFVRLHAPEVWGSTPSFVEIMLRDKHFDSKWLPSIDTFILGGEVLSKKTVAELKTRFKNCRVLNIYGPTEATCAVSALDVNDYWLARNCPLPVGHLKPGTDILVCDRDGNALSTNQIGEIIIAGDNVGIGYLGAPRLGKEAFFAVEGRRAYRTGDAGYIDENRCLHYRGRLDRQIKLHGNRIELEEIEEVFRNHADVRGVACFPREIEGKIVSLRAVVQINTHSSLDEDQLRIYLTKQLPPFMVPAEIVIRRELPLNPNGKIDRQRLKEELFHASA